MKKDERARAIEMRKEGKTYGEILEAVSVAKSTLSLWLRSVGLATPQKQRITRKRIEAQRKGALSRHTARMRQIEDLVQTGRKEVGSITERELWLIGATLYWAEGSKQHAHNPSVGVIFSNSDSAMHRCFLKWLLLIKIPAHAIYFELFVHKSREKDITVFKQWWERELRLTSDTIKTAYLKPGKIKTNRHNIDDLYHGLLRIRVAESTSLNRKIQGWIHGIARCAE